MPTDHRDVVIEMLADSEYDLAAKCAGLREVLHAAFDRLHEQDREIQQLRKRCYAALDELRRYRAQQRAA